MTVSAQQVNFRTESSVYKQAKTVLDNETVSISDVLNATLRKIATGAINPVEFVTSDTISDDTLQTAFSDLKKEILLGHQDILAGKTKSLSEVREAFHLD